MTSIAGNWAFIIDLHMSIITLVVPFLMSVQVALFIVASVYYGSEVSFQVSQVKSGLFVQ